MADDYVTNDAWLHPSARADAIDEIADQFERPSGANAFWTEISVRRVERNMRVAPRTIERRAG
jgi:hypothetical protein